MKRSIPFLFSILTLSFGFLPAAHASDGVIELNQACATGNGCLANDSPGFPISVTILDTARNFILTGDLVVPDENTSAISFSAIDGVRIDLNGFSIRGITSCSGSPTSCAPTGNGIGVQGTLADDIEILNGTIEGMGKDGIRLTDRATIRDVRTTENGATGMSLQKDSAVYDSVSTRNGSTGISVSDGSLIDGCRSADNAGNGIIANGSIVSKSHTSGNDFDGISGSKMMVFDSFSSNNAGNGIAGSIAVTAHRNQVIDNDGGGIAINNSGVFIGNLAHSNGSTTSDDGFSCTTRCTFVNNVSTSNAGDGFSGGSGAAYRGLVTGSNAGFPVSGGTDLGDNLLN